MQTSPVVVEVINPPRCEWGVWKVDVIVDYMGCPKQKTLEFKTKSEADEVGGGMSLRVEAEQLAKQIKSSVKPEETWMVMNGNETGACMFFDGHTYHYPKKACEKWFAAQNKSWIADNGYHIVKKDIYTDAEDLAIKAADMILRLLNEQKATNELEN